MVYVIPLFTGIDCILGVGMILSGFGRFDKYTFTPLVI